MQSNQTTVNSFSALSSLLSTRAPEPKLETSASNVDRQHPPTDFLKVEVFRKVNEDEGIHGTISHLEFSFKDDTIRPRIMNRIHLYDAFAEALREYGDDITAANFAVRYGSQVQLENMPFLHSNVSLTSVFDPLQTMRDPVVELLKNGNIVLIAVPSQSYHFKSRAAANTSSFRTAKPKNTSKRGKDQSDQKSVD
jgi:hypothetical protein